MNNTNTLLETIFSSDDLLEVADCMASYAKEALNSTDPESMAEEFHIHLSRSIRGLVSGEGGYLLYGDEISAIHLLIWASLPPFLSPKRYLSSIAELGSRLSANFTKAENTPLSNELAGEILYSLGECFEGFGMMYTHLELKILPLNYIYKGSGGVTIIKGANKNVPPCLFLTVSDIDDDCKRTSKHIFSFYHDLASILFHYWNSLDTQFPFEMYDMMVDLGLEDFNKIDTVECSEQDFHKLLINTLTLGLMYEGPHANFVPFPELSGESKRALANLSRKLIKEFVHHFIIVVE